MSQSHAIYVVSVILKPSSSTYIKRLWNYFHQISSQVVKRAIIKAVGLYIVLSLLSEGLQHNWLPGILWQKAHKWLNYKGYNGMRAASHKTNKKHNDTDSHRMCKMENASYSYNTFKVLQNSYWHNTQVLPCFGHTFLLSEGDHFLFWLNDIHWLHHKW